jgi:hypothetical protein
VLPITARVIALACLALSAPCFAQTPEEVRSDAQIHLGAFYITPRFAVKEFGVDTNVFHDDQARRDFTFTFTPSARVSTPFGRRAVVTTTVATDIVYYQRFASERSINPDVTFRTKLFLGRLEPFAETGYLHTRQRPNQEIDARSLREEQSFKGGARIKFASKTSVDLSVEQRNVDYAAEERFNDVQLQETLNRRTHRRLLEARYDATPLTTFTLRSEAVRDRFEFSPLRDANSSAVIPGVEFKARALVSGHARIGARRFSPVNTTLSPFSGAVASASLSYTLQGTTRMTFSADRDLTYSYERLQPYYVLNGIGVWIRRQVVGAFDITLGAQRQRHNYRNLILPGATVDDLNRVDTVRGVTGSLGYRIGNTMRAGFGLTYRERESNSMRFRDYRGFRFITTLDYEL